MLEINVNVGNKNEKKHEFSNKYKTGWTLTNYKAILAHYIPFEFINM